jgi:hypothetical protein
MLLLRELLISLFLSGFASKREREEKNGLGRGRFFTRARRQVTTEQSSIAFLKHKSE